MHGVTFDTGALIALERGKQRMREIWATAHSRGYRLTVPTAVLAEWWRGRTDLREDILAAVHVEPLSAELAKAVGEALGQVDGATAIDAVVMASAAQRGDVVFTADVEDLERLRARFPEVRVLRV